MLHVNDFIEPNQAATLKDVGGGVYTVVSTTPASVLATTLETLTTFMLGDYAALFPDWEPGDSLDLRDTPGGSIIVHKKRVTDYLKLPAGFYYPQYIKGHLSLISLPKRRQDPYIALSTTHGTSVLQEDIKTFFLKRDIYEEYNLPHRRGALIYGSQGNGKTLTISKVTNQLIENGLDLVVIFMSNIDYEGLLPLRQALELAKHNVVLVLEEIADLVENSYGLLTFLDGEQSWNGYLIATTNKPEDLPETISDRPGRFDLLVEATNPTAEDRRLYLEARLPDQDISDGLIEITAGFSVAHLKEVIVRSRLKETTLEQAAKQIVNAKETVKRRFSTKEATKLAFTL